MKAFLGMGLLGSNFVRAMRQRGEELQVWNRTHSKALALEETGAKAFEHVEDAVKGVTQIHITLRDDASVDEVLDRASKSFEKGTIIIDHTTTSKEGSIKRYENWKERGFTYLHAPVFMGPANALSSTGFMLVSGDQALINQLEPSLSKMTGKLVNLGTEIGKAAALKLAGNAFLVCFTFSLRETLNLSKALDLVPEDLQNLFSFWNPGEQARPRLKRMTSEDLTKPSWELAMARKDTGLFLDAVKDTEFMLDLLPNIAGVMDEYIEKGFGEYDWTIVGRDVVETKK